jgi:hypothetical protein
MSVVQKRLGKAAGLSALDKRRFDRSWKEWSRRRASAQTRTGRTPIERLRWLLGFATRTRQELCACDKSELANIAAEVWTFAERVGMNMNRDASKPVSADELAALAETIKDGLDRLCGAKPDVAGWHFEPLKFGNLNYAIQAQTFRSYYFGDYRPVFLMGAAELLSQEGRRIRKCAWTDCSRLFVRRKRGAYCSAACSQKARTKRHQDTQGAEALRKKRHDYYVRQVEKLRGKSVAKKVRARMRAIHNEGSEVK